MPKIMRRPLPQILDEMDDNIGAAVAKVKEDAAKAVDTLGIKVSASNQI